MMLKYQYMLDCIAFEHAAVPHS